MKMKVGWLILSCLIVAGLVLASCAPAEEAEEGKTITGKVVEKEEKVVEEKEVVEEEKGPKMIRNTAGKMEEEPQYGGTVTRSGRTQLVGFDPAYTVSWQCFQMSYTHDPLLAGDFAKGGQGTNETGFRLYTFLLGTLAPYLAESYEFPDEETIIFHLRKGVHWQNLPPVNGREFVADDVVFSFIRLFEIPESYLVTTHKEGKRPTSIKALDKYTVEIKVPAGCQGPIFRDLSAQTRPIAPEIVEMYGDHKDWKHNVGTGPWILTEWVPASCTTYTRNPNYWMEDPLLPGYQLPFLDSWKYLFIPDLSTRLAALRTGKIDADDGILWEDKESLIQTTPELVHARFGINEMGVGMKTDKAPFNDIRVRKALWLAMDNESIKDEFYGGNAAMLSYPVKDLGDFSSAYVPLEELPESTQELYGYDPDKAKELLAEAGYPNGFKAEMVCYALQSNVDLATILQDQWSRVGVEIEITPLEYASYTSVMIRFQHEDMILADSMWTSSPYKCQTWATGQGRNLSIVSDPWLDEQYDKVVANFLNPAERAAIMKECVPYILDKAWYVQPPNYTTSVFWWPWLKRYNGEYCHGYTQFHKFVQFVWIDQDLKKEMGY